MECGSVAVRVLQARNRTAAGDCKNVANPMRSLAPNQCLQPCLLSHDCPYLVHLIAGRLAEPPSLNEYTCIERRVFTGTDFGRERLDVGASAE